MKRRVFIVDDHPMMRRGYASLMGAEPDLAIAGEAGSTPEALAALADAPPDLLLADISLDGPNGLELTKQILAWYPDLPILVASMHDEELYAERALQAGARGYIMKTQDDERLLRAIRHVLDGHVYLSTAMLDRVLFRLVGRCPGTSPERAGVQELSDRELEVFERIGCGETTEEIADHLTISPKTVGSHRARIKTKLGIGTHVELMRHAVQWVESIGQSPSDPGAPPVPFGYGRDGQS